MLFWAFLFISSLHDSVSEKPLGCYLGLYGAFFFFNSMNVAVTIHCLVLMHAHPGRIQDVWKRCKYPSLFLPSITFVAGTSISEFPPRR